LKHFNQYTVGSLGVS